MTTEIEPVMLKLSKISSYLTSFKAESGCSERSVQQSSPGASCLEEATSQQSTGHPAPPFPINNSVELYYNTKISPLSFSLSNFGSRLQTFGDQCWVLPTSVLSVYECVRRGWCLIQPDMLRCCSCGEVLSVQLPPLQHTAAYTRAVSLLRDRVQNKHSMTCRWLRSPAPLSLSRPPAMLSTAQLYSFSGAAHELAAAFSCRLPFLPQEGQPILERLGMSRSVLEEVWGGPFNSVQASAMLLMFCGWKAVQTKDTLKCELCKRTIGLWRYKSHKQHQEQQSAAAAAATATAAATAAATTAAATPAATSAQDKETSVVITADNDAIASAAQTVTPAVVSGAGCDSELPQPSTVESENSNSVTAADCSGLSTQSPVPMETDLATEAADITTTTVRDSSVAPDGPSPSGEPTQEPSDSISNVEPDVAATETDSSKNGPSLKRKRDEKTDTTENNEAEPPAFAELSSPKRARSKQTDPTVANGESGQSHDLEANDESASAAASIGTGPTATQPCSSTEAELAVLCPLSQHRHWCGWITSEQEHLLASDSRPSSPDVRDLAGYAVFAQHIASTVRLTHAKQWTASEKYSNTVEGLRSVRALLSSWSK